MFDSNFLKQEEKNEDKESGMDYTLSIIKYKFEYLYFRHPSQEGNVLQSTGMIIMTLFLQLIFL